MKPQICKLLDREPQPELELKNSSQQLDEAYQEANKALMHNPDLQMEQIADVARPIVSSLDGVPDTLELLLLQQALTQRL